jgi:hypothetical protein
MHGKIYFNNLGELADFLRSFSGNTSTFEVQYRNNQWVLEFLGGF